jgi:GNAT superfamily N-acetyltransferase
VFSFRQAGPGDVDAVGRAVAAGFEGYRAFAPPFWRPPGGAAEVRQVRALIDAGKWWCLLAEEDGQLAGHVAFLPAAAGIEPVHDARLAHLRQLFVERSHWGNGLARTLHAAALEEASARGFRAMRLFTPAGQARARRFYEREGWVCICEPRDAAAGLPTVEYRRELP